MGGMSPEHTEVVLKRVAVRRDEQIERAQVYVAKNIPQIVSSELRDICGSIRVAKAKISSGTMCSSEGADEKD